MTLYELVNAVLKYTERFGEADKLTTISLLVDSLKESKSLNKAHKITEKALNYERAKP